MGSIFLLINFTLYKLYLKDGASTDSLASKSGHTEKTPFLTSHFVACFTHTRESGGYSAGSKSGSGN